MKGLLRGHGRWMYGVSKWVSYGLKWPESFFIHAFCCCNVGMDVIYDLMDY